MSLAVRFLCALLLLGVAQSGKLDPNGKFQCSKLKPLKNITISELAGDWVTINELLFEEGVPNVFPTPSEAMRPNNCIRNEVESVNDTSITWTPFYSFFRGHESKGRAFVVTRKPNGRWSLHSKEGHTMQGGKMLILAGDPERYLVRAMCFPSKPGESTRPGLAGSKGVKGRGPLLVKTVSVESRRQPGQVSRGSLTAEELIEVKLKVAKILDMPEFKPAQFGFYC